MSNEQFFVEEPAEKTVDAAAPVDVFIAKEEVKKIKSVSFSQYSKWLKCPMSWKLSYIDKLAPYEASIHTTFGTAIHAALQEYLRLLYTVDTKAADSFDAMGLFKKEYEEGLKDLKIATDEQIAIIEEKMKDQVLTDEERLDAIKEELDALGFITKEIVAEFENDGKVILDHVLGYSIRAKHFPSKKYELVGIELPLEIPLRGGTILYKGFLDIVLRDKDTKKILILDFKTSTRGWGKWGKQDRTKIDQLILYKRFYNQMFKIPMSDIEVEFFIMKRKLLENVGFPQNRIERFSPADGKMSVKEVETSFLQFINEGFDTAGEYNKETVFLKNPDKAKKNCKYCIFKTLKNSKGELYCNGKEGR
jgi:hypothetical protein